MKSNISDELEADEPRQVIGLLFIAHPKSTSTAIFVVSIRGNRVREGRLQLGKTRGKAKTSEDSELGEEHGSIEVQSKMR